MKMNPEKPFRIIGIDPGFHHLGLTVIDVDRETLDMKVIHCSMMDLRKLRCKNPNCLYEKNDGSGGHRTLHYVEENAEWFKGADYVVMEQQPIMSTLKDVEHVLLLLIKQQFSNGRRDYARQISPRTLHAHFNMSSEKVERRVEVVELTKHLLGGHRAFDNAVEKDHISDSCAFALLFVHTVLPEIIRKSKPNPFAKFSFNPAAALDLSTGRQTPES